MVSIVIGKNGYKIKDLQAKTHTKIYIESYKAKESIWSCAKIAGRLHYKNRRNKKYSRS